jgi:hypothetical protein
VLQDLREGTDHTIINDYFDTIEKLVTLVLEGQGQRAKDEGLCDAVLHLQEVGGSEGLAIAAFAGNCLLAGQLSASRRCCADLLVCMKLRLP